MDEYLLRAKKIIRHHHRRKDDAPLFLLYSTTAVHTPIQAKPSLKRRVVSLRSPEYWVRCEWQEPLGRYQHPTRTTAVWNTCDEEATELRKVYEALALSIDDAVAGVVEALKDTGMWENTLFAFVSDNGGAVGTGGSNKPLRGGKMSKFDGGIRVAAGMGGPWLPEELRGNVSTALMHIADFHSTLAYAAGVQLADRKSALVPDLDSFNMWPQWLTGMQAQNQPRRHILIDKAVVIYATGAGKLFKYSEENLVINCMGDGVDGRSCVPVVWKHPDGSFNAAYSYQRGDLCTAKVPCLYELLSDEREAVRLEPTQPQYAQEVHAMKQFLQEGLLTHKPKYACGTQI